MQQKSTREPLNTSSSVLFSTMSAPGVLIVNNLETEPIIKEEVIKRPSWINHTFLFLLVIATVSAGSLNRVAGKVVTVPMNEYSFFLACFNSITYVALYFTILLFRYCLGIVPGKMLSSVWARSGDTSLNFISRLGPWKYFLICGFLDGLATILLLIGSPYLPGHVIFLGTQFSILFSMIISSLILKKRYTFWEFWSVLLLYCGVCITLIPQLTGIDKSLSLYYSLIMAFVALPNSLSVVLKEKLFQNYNFDLFIVNSHGSLFQLITFPIFLPFAIIFGQTQGQSLQDYIINGFDCFIGKTPMGSPFDCSPDPYPYLVYISLNVIYNLFLLLLVKRASAVLSFMTVQAILPGSVILFYFNWPLLDAEKFSYWTVLGLIVIVAALPLYQFFSLEKKKIDRPCFSLSLPWLEKALNRPKYIRVKEEKNQASID